MGRPIGIDLFAGAGGLSLGFEQAGFDIVAAVELDPIHSAVHKFNFPETETICASVSDATGDVIRERAKLGDADIDIVFGGAPCQGFSMIGKRALDDPRNSLVGDFVRRVHELQPRYFVFENVPGLTVGEHRHFLEELIAEFNDNEDSNHRIVEDYQVLRAPEFGVPQDRRRLFLLGARKDQLLPSYPDPTHRYRLAAKGRDRELPPGPSVWDAIGDLPEIDDFQELFERDWVRASFGNPSEYARRLRGLANDDLDYSYPRIFDRDVLTSSLRTRHTELSRSRFKATPHGETEKVSRFHKLDPQGLCNTIRAGTASDRGAFTSPRPIHPHTPRCISNREAARLHGYPDWFRLHTTKWHGFRQIGNSVPPPLARAVAFEIIRTLGIAPMRPAKPVDLGPVDLLSIAMKDAAREFGVSHRVIPPRTRQRDYQVAAYG